MYTINSEFVEAYILGHCKYEDQWTKDKKLLYENNEYTFAKYNELEKIIQGDFVVFDLDNNLIPIKRKWFLYNYRHIGNNIYQRIRRQVWTADDLITPEIEYLIMKGKLEISRNKRILKIDRQTITTTGDVVVINNINYKNGLIKGIDYDVCEEKDIENYIENYFEAAESNENLFSAEIQEDSQIDDNQNMEKYSKSVIEINEKELKKVNLKNAKLLLDHPVEAAADLNVDNPEQSMTVYSANKRIDYENMHDYAEMEQPEEERVVLDDARFDEMVGTDPDYGEESQDSDEIDLNER